MSSDKENVSQEQQEAAPDLASILSNFPGSPDSTQLESWKEEYGEIFCSGFSPTELFIFRPLSWKEHKNIQKKLVTPPAEGEEPLTEFDFQEMVVETCLLWTCVKNATNKGGTIPTLFEQVMMNSNFMDPRMAAAFVIKL